MSKVDFKLNLAGLNEIMKSGEMQSILDAKGNEIASRAKSMCPKGEYSVRTYPINFIAVCNVSAENFWAIKDGYENNTLLKALGGG